RGARRSDASAGAGPVLSPAAGRPTRADQLGRAPWRHRGGAGTAGQRRVGLLRRSRRAPDPGDEERSAGGGPGRGPDCRRRLAAESRGSDRQRLMRFDVVTIFPGMFGPVFQQGVIGRAIERGAIPAMVLIDATARLVPGVVGDPGSLAQDSFVDEMTGWPQFTRPAEYRGMTVPDVLLSGDHARIRQWRRQQAAQRRVPHNKELKKT